MPRGTRLPSAARAATALAPVRAYLVHEAITEANRIRATARAEGDALLRQARAEAERAEGLGTALGQSEAAPLAAAARGRGRAQARSIVLRAQREVYDELCRQIMAEADVLRGEPGYERLLSRLGAMAAQTAGPAATLSFPLAGGVLARAGQVVVDCSLPRLATQAVQGLGDRVRELWEP